MRREIKFCSLMLYLRLKNKMCLLSYNENRKINSNNFKYKK